MSSIVEAVEAVILVCGDRNWSARTPIVTLLAGQPADGRTIVITGGARGADSIGHQIAMEYGHRSIVVAAAWGAYAKLAGPRRNRWMLELLWTIHVGFPNARAEVHAFHEHIAQSRGTANMLKQVREAAFTIPYKIHSDPQEIL
jgi:hypothetical protein